MTTDTDTATVAPDLGPRGQAFWAATLATFALSDVELQLLTECCHALDECDRLRAAVEMDGAVVQGSTGQPRVHPALAELRQQRVALGKLMAQLDLPDEDGDTLMTPTQARATKAARTRWSAQRTHRG